MSTFFHDIDPNGGCVPLHLLLDQDEDPPPPYQFEVVAARELRPGLLSIESIPVWASGVSRLDEVRYRTEGSRLTMTDIASTRLHSVLRVFVTDPSIQELVCRSLAHSGCAVYTLARDGVHVTAVDVPFTVDLDVVIGILESWDEETVEFEGTSIRHPDKDQISRGGASACDAESPLSVIAPPQGRSS